jgi:hypothetical protein
MQHNETLGARARRSSRAVVAGGVGVALLGTALLGATAEAANGGYPKAYNPETVAPYTNTFTPQPADLKPTCPEAIAGTPGSDPASKKLNTPLNTAASFQAGGTVHFVYTDNPHVNGGTANFTIQDCMVTYPAGTFTAADFDADGVLINPTTSVLKGGTQLDGAELSGISAPTGPIYYSWTVPATLDAGTWVCSFARDIRNNHGGGGNRKVPPTCFQVQGPPPPPSTLGRVAPKISLAYVDNFHDATGTSISWHPTPWLGDPGIVFVGCKSDVECGKFDGGAIMITNDPANNGPLTLESASVTIGDPDDGGCFFHPWDALISGGGQTAQPGESFILTQTGLGGPPMPAPCREAIDPLVWDYTNFDTSERPGDNRGFPTIADRRFDCDTSTGHVPVITLKFTNDTVLTINDTGKILNTGGVDVHACGGTNEATPWTLVSS